MGEEGSEGEVDGARGMKKRGGGRGGERERGREGEKERGRGGGSDEEAGGRERVRETCTSRQIPRT